MLGKLANMVYELHNAISVCCCVDLEMFSAVANVVKQKGMFNRCGVDNRYKYFKIFQDFFYNKSDHSLNLILHTWH